MSAAKFALAGTALLALAASYGSYTWNFEWRPPVAYDGDGFPVARIPVADATGCYSAKLASGTYKDAAAVWATCKHSLAAYGALEEFNRDFRFTVGSGVAAASGFAGLVALAMFGGRRPRHLRGPKKLTGRANYERLARTLFKEAERSGLGLNFPPSFFLSRDRESRHIMITGGVGSGKTQTMWHLILGAYYRGDQVLVLDTKGDMTVGMPGEIQLLAPQDERSAAWAVAQDCTSRQDARELAARFIPKSDDPMWSEAARSLLVACIVSLQAENPGKWTWADLYARTVLKPEALQALADRYYTAASQLIADPASKTALSILTTFKAHLPTIEALADAWGRGQDEAFSVARWLSEGQGTGPVILQRDGRYPELSNAWISSLIGLMASHIGSPSFPESKERRVWLVLDEFPQLERMEDFSTLLDLGRSKGICIVLAAQDTSQIRARYGRDRTNAWLSMVGTHLITRMSVGEGAEDVSRALGMAEVEVPVRSRSYSGGKVSDSTSMQVQTRPVMTSSEIASELGPRKKLIRVLLVGVGQDYYIINVPYCRLRCERLPHIPAKWTLTPPKSVEGSEEGESPQEPPPPPAPPTPRLTEGDVSQILGTKRELH